MNLKLSYNNNELISPFLISDYSLKEIYYNNLQQADNACSIKIPYDVDIQNFINNNIDNNISAQIINDDNSIKFTGYLRKNFSFSKKQRNQPISLEIVSPSFLLDVDTTTDIFLTDTTLSTVVNELLTQAGFSTTTLSLSQNINLFTLESGTNIKTTLNDLLLNYGYTFDFNNLGNFVVESLFDIPSTNLITQEFNGNNIIDEVKVDKKEQEYNGVSLEWQEYKEIANSLIFADTSNGSADDNSCSIELEAGKYLTSGTDDDTESYYITYDNANGDIVYISNATLTLTSSNNSGLIYSFENLGTKGLISVYNNTASTITITKINVNGTGYVISSDNTTKSNTGKKFNELSGNFIHNSELAETFTNNYRQWQEFADYNISLKSKNDFELGSFVKVSESGLGTIYGRIIQKSYKLNKPIEYSIEAVSEYTPSEATTEKTQTSKVNNSANTITPALEAPILTGLVNSDGTISLTWTQSNSDKVKLYKVYRSSFQNSFELITTTNDLSFIDADISNNEFTYKIKNENTSGIESVFSNEVVLTSTTNLKPSIPTNFLATATENYIDISFDFGLDNSNSQKIKCYVLSLSKDAGTTYSDIATLTENKYEYNFNRTTDGFPEISDLQNYRFKIRSKSNYNIFSDDVIATVNTASYGTWQLQPPVINTRISDRTITLIFSQPIRADNLQTYGNIFYKVQIKRPDVDNEYFKPAESLDPYDLETNYKIIGNTGFVKSDSVYVQTMPLSGQSTNNIVDTLYSFSVIASNEASTSTATTINATATCTSIRDIVKANETAKSAYIEMLSAISANIGIIKQGSLNGSDNNYWALSTVIDENNNKKYEGAFRVGGENQYLKVIPIVENEIITDYDLEFKVGNFIVSTLASEAEFTDGLILTDSTNSNRRLKLLASGMIAETKINNVWTLAGKITIDSAGNMIITNSENCPALYTPAPDDSYIYHLTSNLLDTTGQNTKLLSSDGSYIEDKAPTQENVFNGTIEIPSSSATGDICFFSTADDVGIKGTTAKGIPVCAMTAEECNDFVETSSAGLTEAQVAQRLFSYKE